MHKLIPYGRFHLSFHMAVMSEYDINSRRSVTNTMSFSSLYLPACFWFSICCWRCTQFVCNNLAKYKAWEYLHVWARTRNVREGCMGHSVSLQLCECVCPQEHPRSPCCLSCHLAYLASLCPSCLSAVLPNLPTSTCLPALTKQVSQIWQHSPHTVSHDNSQRNVRNECVMERSHFKSWKLNLVYIKRCFRVNLILLTKRRGWLDWMPAFCAICHRVKSWPLDWQSSLKVFMVFLSSSRKMGRCYLKLGHVHFLPHHFQFVVH
jgi:hypothetical protein